MTKREDDSGGNSRCCEQQRNFLYFFLFLSPVFQKSQIWKIWQTKHENWRRTEMVRKQDEDKDNKFTYLIKYSHFNFFLTFEEAGKPDKTRPDYQGNHVIIMFISKLFHKRAFVPQGFDQKETVWLSFLTACAEKQSSPNHSYNSLSQANPCSVIYCNAASICCCGMMSQP